MPSERRYCYSCFTSSPALNCMMCLQPSARPHREWRALQLDQMMRALPTEFATRWCEPDERGCACMGCANGSESGAGGLSAKGFTKEDWKQWWRLHLTHLTV